MYNSTRLRYHCCISLFLIFLFGYDAAAQELYPVKLKSANWHGEQRTLRYHPEGEDFVITNGNRRFNRALYGTHTAFRVEAGDLPEFSMYMPGLGGTLKLALVKGGKRLWLIDAKQVTARYTPGKMSYEVQDPLLGKGKMLITVLALSDAEGMIVQARYEGVEKDLNLVYAFGGASGKKFSRSGDMGPDPESSFYLTAENCKNNQYTISENTFELRYGTGVGAKLSGTFPSALKLADAEKLADAAALLQSTGTAMPVLVSKVKLAAGNNLYAMICNPLSKLTAHSNAEVSEMFNAAELSRKNITSRIQVNTPDAYINTLGAAISIASDATWEEPSYLHGAVGWRMRLNGWRGPYTADPLGWHDRAKMHYASYAKSQVLEPAAGPVIADTAFHLARHQEQMGTSMFTSGYISRDPNGKSIRPHHYDMNLIYIDGLLWHFNWTGDKVFAKEMWPVLQRHFDWEKRNFDPDDDGLYDAYAVIWASDALYYSGGAVTHSSAYNYRANKKAAEIAVLLGEDAAPYKKEADKILKAMNTQLWMADQGVYAEYKDGMGLKKLHPSAALWTVYHSIDSDVPDAFQAFQSLRYVDQEIPHIPVRAAGLADGQYYTLSTSSWMPYRWSINNVAMAESMHTALANWESGRNEEGFKLFKSELLAAMYLGGSPGNFVQISHYDAVRAEAYRDFGDPVGISSRALIEGLFGIIPDALHGKLTVRPGFPASWGHASLVTPDLDFKFKRNALKDEYHFNLSFAVPLALNLQLKARGTGIASILVNGKKASWKNIADAIGQPMVEIKADAAAQYHVEIVWKGEEMKKPVLAASYAIGDQLQIDFEGAVVMQVKDPQQVFEKVSYKGGRLNSLIGSHMGNRTAFVQLKKGDYSWWYPVCFELKPVVSIAAAKPAHDELAFKLVNNSNTAIKGTLSVKEFKQPISLSAGDSTALISLPRNVITAGTSNLYFLADGGGTTKLELINWSVTQKNLGQRNVDLAGYFNDQVAQVFKNKYLAPRPVGPTLQLPWQGIGDWPHALEMVVIDDAGLRKTAGSANVITLPQGIRFQTPGEAGLKNIVFTSQWDNYPSEKEIPLTGKAGHAYFLMAGTTNHMQSQLDNGQITVNYTDGSADTLLLRNPETWWPIQEDYYTDGFAFNLSKPKPIRISLKTGAVIPVNTQRAGQQMIDGGAATVLDLTLDPDKTLKNLKLLTLANDVVIGLMAITLTAQ